MLSDLNKRIRRALRGKRTTSIDTLAPHVIGAQPHVLPQFERMADWLPYTAFLKEQGLFLLEVKDGKGGAEVESLGFSMDLHCPSGAGTDMANTFTALIQEAPAHACMQIQIFASSDIESYLASYESPRQGDLYIEMAKHRAQFYRNATQTSPFTSQPFLLRQFRLVLSCTLAISDIENLNEIDRISMWRDRTVATMRATNLFIKSWEPQDLIDWNWRLLNAQQMYKPKETHKYDSSRLIRSQMRDPQTVTRIGEQGDRLLFTQAKHEPMAMRTYSVSSYPERFDFQNVTQLLGDFQTTTRQYTCPFLITMGLLKPDFERKKNRVNIAAVEATRKTETPLAKIDPSLLDKKRDWDIMQEAYKEGTGGVELYHQILLFCRSDEEDLSEEALRSVWRARGFTLANDTYMAMQALLSALPMSLTTSLAKDIKIADRFSTKTTRNVISLTPLITEWTGYGDIVVPLIGRRGTVAGIDLFSNDEGNYNFCVVGTSGSGKSVFCNELVLAYLGIGGRAWVIDVGGSYKKLCGTLGGQYIQFTQDNDICLNPFPMIRSIEEDMEMVHPLLGQMAAGLVGNGITSLQYAAIGQAIRLAWQVHGRATTVTIIRDLLKDGKFNPNDPYDKEIADVAILLDKYCVGGAYGKYFEGEPNLKFTSDFVVLELEELKSKKDLQSVVLLIMMYRITDEMYLGRRDRKKIVLIDEAWDLLNGGQAASAFIEAGYRRARKYGGAFGTATQGMDDYFKNPAAEAAFNNSDFLFILRTKEASIATMESTKRIAMTPAMKSAIQGLKKIDGEYSEVYVICPKGHSVFRCMVDAYSLLVYSSKGADFEAVEELTQQGIPIRDAITQVLVQREASKELLT